MLTTIANEKRRALLMDVIIGAGIGLLLFAAQAGFQWVADRLQ